MESIGKRLKRLRILVGLDQKEVAELMHVRRETIGTWERGTNNPSPICENKLQGILNGWEKFIIMSNKL